MILVDVDGATVRRPERALFEGLSFTVSSGERWGIVGMNGTGKSTLMRVIAGQQQPDDGTVRRGRGVRIGVLDQEPELPGGPVREVLPPGWEAEAMLTRLGSGDLLDRRTEELSGGQVKRVALAGLLAGEHDLVLLDEPTNHLDLEAVDALESWLAGFRGGLVLITHDRHLLDRVTTRILELERGRGYVHLPSGEDRGSGYAAYLRRRAEREEVAQHAEQARRNLARRELAWLRRGAPARTSKPKARIAAAERVIGDQPQRGVRDQPLEMGGGGRRLGNQVIELRDVGFSWPGGHQVLCHVDRVLEPGDRIGIVGPNGAGKSTLLGLLAGELLPTEGDIVRGSTVLTAHHTQTGRELPADATVRELVAGPKGRPGPEDVRLMERFWFDGDAQFAPVALLSGGERRRLQLLLTLAQQPNVLVLDEPTNDLDLDTLRALEDFLDSWPGVLVVASHDRTFLDRTVSEVWALDGEGSSGEVREVRGGVAGWLAERASARVAASGPERVPTRPERQPTGRSPSTLRRLLGQTEREVAQARAQHERLLERMADRAGAGDHAALTSLAAELAEVEAAVQDAEGRWLLLAEEAEAQGWAL